MTTTLTEYKRLIVMEHTRVLAEDELDVLLRILGHDPDTLRAPPPNMTVQHEELEGGA